MKKKIVTILVLMLFITSITINVVGYSNSKIEENYGYKNSEKIKNLQDGVDQEQTHDDGVGQGIYAGQWLAQSFRPTVDEITAVQLYLFGYGTTSHDYLITVSIRDDLVGDDLTAVTVIADQVGEFGWLSFDFPDIDIIKEKEYYIVVRSDDGDEDNNYGCFMSDTNTYSGGQPFRSHDSGSFWVALSGDFCFKTMYTEEESNSRIISILRQIFRENQYYINLFK